MNAMQSVLHMNIPRSFIHVPKHYSSTTGLRTAVALKLYTYPITYSSTSGLRTAVAQQLNT